MAQRGRPPKQAQNLFDKGQGTSTLPTPAPAAETAQDASADEIQEQAAEEPSQSAPDPVPPVEKKLEVRNVKIVVYAISKNESKFVKRWMDSMKEADAVVVLDTGSSDETVKLLKAEGAEVEQKRFVPWRFDTSRNASIDLAVRLHPDADLLVCTDLDEYFVPGWRAKLEKAWRTVCADSIKKNMPLPTTVQYEYVWNFHEDGSDGTKFWYEKIHTPSSGARWTHPVHEILSYPTKKVMVRVPSMRLEHHADPTKSRGQYLPLLEMSVKEAPMDDRNMHYLGREYMFRGRWDDAIYTLKKHLALPTATWLAERGSSMRFIARCYGEKGDRQNQEIWLWRAISESVKQREAALDLAELFNKEKDWSELVRVCEIMLSRTEKVMTYITKAEAWGSRPYDLYSVGLWNTGKCKEAVAAAKQALALDPNNARIKKNIEVMEKFISDAANG